MFLPSLVLHQLCHTVGTELGARWQWRRRPGNGPLAGVRVVELAGIGPGPFAAMLLADLGADVVRVDRPGGAGLAVNPAYDLTNRNKRSVLDRPQGRRRARPRPRPGRARRHPDRGLPARASPNGSASARTTCHARNPRLVYGRMTGWGQDGPARRTRAGHDIAYIALTGTLGMIGEPGRAARRPRQPGRRLRGRLALPGRRRARRPPARPRRPAPARSSTRPSSTAPPTSPR